MEPAFTVDPHLVHSKDYAVWFTEPLGIVTQVRAPIFADLAMSRFITDDVYPKLRELAAASHDVGPAKYVFIHDWRLAEGYHADARKHLTEWARSIRGEIGHLTVILGDETPALTRMGVNVAFTAMRMVGVDARSSNDLPRVIAELGLRPHPGA